MNKTVIIDYGAGNIRSVANMLSYLDVPYEITSERDKILKAERIIFPGQGHFAQAMENLEQKNLDTVIKTVCKKGIPFLGICIGLQILFESSEEAPGKNGLGIFKGYVKRFKNKKVPQIGWSKIQTQSSKYLQDEYYYFVNSYYVVPDDNSIISAIGDYQEKYCAAVEQGNITAVQFHPEKSANAGLAFFENWLGKYGIN